MLLCLKRCVILVLNLNRINLIEVLLLVYFFERFNFFYKIQEYYQLGVEEIEGELLVQIFYFIQILGYGQYLVVVLKKFNDGIIQCKIVKIKNKKDFK